jgi:predicted N-acetyltransferase YhbS
LIQIVPALAADLAEIDTLLDEGFGPARHNRTAYRLRDHSQPDPMLSFVARDHGKLVGSVQCWPIRLLVGLGTVLPMVLLGPVAVAADRRGEGIASALVEASLASVDAIGAVPILLIGDISYYCRFGFSAEPTAGWELPGPVDRDRLLLRWAGAALPKVGIVEPADASRRAA